MPKRGAEIAKDLFKVSAKRAEDAYWLVKFIGISGGARCSPVFVRHSCSSAFFFYRRFSDIQESYAGISRVEWRKGCAGRIVAINGLITAEQSVPLPKSAVTVKRAMINYNYDVLCIENW